jgi:hypothetical protein
MIHRVGFRAVYPPVNSTLGNIPGKPTDRSCDESCPSRGSPNLGTVPDGNDLIPALNIVYVLLLLRVPNLRRNRVAHVILF